MKYLSFTIAAALAFLCAQSAIAAQVSIGGFEFDDSQYGQSATSTTASVSSLGNAVDGSLGTYALNQSGEIQMEFGYDVFNESGYDFLVFECCSRESVSASLNSGDTGILGTFLSSESSQGGGTIHIFGYDLSDLGLSAGGNAGSTLFFSASGADILEAALLSIDGSSTSPIPLPAAGWLLFGALGGLAAVGRRKS